jgi:hypothetical protein
MTPSDFTTSLTQPTPPPSLSIPLQALWWDARGDWSRAHSLVDDLETPEAMAVHAYLHRKQGEHTNADYWYDRSTRDHLRPNLPEEWSALVQSLLHP